MKPSQHFVGSNFELPPLPPGSALKFAREAEAEQRFPSLLSNLEGEMARLLEWASAGDAKVAPRRQGGLAPLPGAPSAAGPITHTAEVRQAEVRDFLKERNDVHQRRAKRREIAESTAVRLPREVQGGRVRRGGKDREVSYLSDGPAGAAGAPMSVPASVIPDAFKILMESPFPTREPNFYGLFGEEDPWQYNERTRHFVAVLFPSKVPAGRRDVLLLHAWVNDMISRLKQTSSTLREEEMLKDAQLLFSVAFHEIIRQVSVQCMERGHLMGKIWWSEMELFNRLLQLHRKSENTLKLERERHAVEKLQMQEHIEALQEELRMLKDGGGGQQEEPQRPSWHDELY